MERFGEFMRKQDVFGHAVTLNYRGDEQFRTVWGAFLTVAQRVFILVVAVIGVIDLFNYKDPNIIQYTVYDRRSEQEDINFGENYGSFYFGLLDLDTGGLNVPFDFSKGTMELYVVEKSYEQGGDVKWT